MSLVAALGGCVSGPHASAGEPTLGEIPVVRDARDIVLPFDSYLSGIREWNVPDRAINILGRDCMRRFGLDWPVVESTPPNSDALVYRRRYGLFDPDHAATYGYNAAGSSHGAWQPIKDRDPTSEEAAVWAGLGLRAVGGQNVPEGGCAGEAIRTLEVGKPAPEINPEQLAFESKARAEQDSRVVSAIAAWSDCMEGRGFPYDTPSEANNDPRWSGGAATPSEIETASADVACKKEVNLIAIWLAVETAYQSRLIEENFIQLEELKRYQESVAANAARVVAGGR